MKEKTFKYSTLATVEKAKLIKNILIEQKSKDIKLLDISAQSQMTDMVIILSAGSLRHAKALADKIAEIAKKENFEFLHTEGYESAQWILVDMNDFVVHIFQEEARSLYDLEGLWHEAKEVA